MNSNNLDSILLITSKNPENRHFGTGFAIYHFENSSWVVTCAHVVNSVGGEVSLEVNGSAAKIVSISESDDLDLSLLETTERLNIPVIKLGLHGHDGSPFTTAGFQLFGKHFAIKRIAGKLIQQNELVSKSLSKRIKAWAITILGDDTLQDGYSGAPIIDDENGFCIGIINYKQGDGKNGLAISIEELERILPTVSPSLIYKPLGLHANNSYADILFEKAIRLQITGDLQESLDVFREIKNINPAYSHIDMMINSVKGELNKGYVNHGRVIPERLLEVRQEAKQSIESRRDYAPQARFPFLSIGCMVVVLITLAILGYFLLRWWLGW